MRAITVSAGPFAAGNAALLAASQAPTIGTPLTLTGSQPDAPRRVLITPGADAVTTRTMTIVGTNWAGDKISEVLPITTGATATVSALDYKTVTSITPTGTGWSANVEAGTSVSGTNSPVGSSPWVRLDDYGFAPLQISVSVVGTVNYSVEFSDDDPNLLPPQTAVAPGAMVWQASDANLASKTANAQDTIAGKPLWARLTINSATASTASAAMTVAQPGGKGG